MATNESANSVRPSQAGRSRTVSGAQLPDLDFGKGNRGGSNGAAAARTAAPRRAPQNGQAARRPAKASQQGYSQQKRASQQPAAKKRRRRKKNSKAPMVALISTLAVLGVGTAAYFGGYFYYSDKFTANTYVNGVDVSGKTFEEAAALFVHEEVPETLQIVRPSEEVVEIPLAEIDYSYNYEQELQTIFDDLDRKSWFACLLKQTEYNFTEEDSYDRQKLFELVEQADWGSSENVNAQIKSGDDGYYVVPEVQGDIFDMQTLEEYIAACLDKSSYTVVGTDSGAYVPPDTVASDYDAKIETLNKMWDLSINYDFNYTKEKLTGKKLCKLINVKRDGSYTVDEDACMKYVEYLAEKYDTYNTERKFKATIQGKITIPTSSDAMYGWWIDQQQTCDQLVDILEKGKNRKSVEPIYYAQGSFEYTGVAEARTENDDIGDTYVEVDLTNQQYWYYEDGKEIRTGYIVSGQTTSEARTTLPGVYKVWFKATNYRMKDSNADGESWDTTCYYWTSVSTVGIGLHDSTWRGAFGGEIYKYNGSHGCINMSYNDAQFVYENVPMGTPVVMYY